MKKDIKMNTHINPCTRIIALFVGRRAIKTPLNTDGIKSARPMRNKFQYLSPGRYFTIKDIIYILNTLNINTKITIHMLESKLKLLNKIVKSVFFFSSSSIMLK